jgi:hypothetical protein
VGSLVGACRVKGRGKERVGLCWVFLRCLEFFLF